MAAKRATNWGLWAKMIGGGLVISIGGPALTYSLVPTEEELFQKYNPDLQKKSLERRYEKQKEFDDFVTKLKAQSKSSQNIWAVAAADKKEEQEAKRLQAVKIAEEVKARRDAMRKEAGLSTGSES